MRSGTSTGPEATVGSGAGTALYYFPAVITPTFNVRAGHPDFLDLDWERSIVDWTHARLMDLPKGISRHEVRFVGYDEGIYAIKELPREPARAEWANLRWLESVAGPAVQGAGYVVREGADPTEEWSTAVITRYLDHSFSYRELLEGVGFGKRRNQMLNAFAALLVELHLLGLFWGDCSLSNVLYQFDADSIACTLVDTETAEVHEFGLSDGQRQLDLEIMVTNVAGGMADIAAAGGRDVDEADLSLGEHIADRYTALWEELHRKETIGQNERWRITERIAALNALGFEVDDVTIQTTDAGSRLRFGLRVGSRRYHRNRLEELTGIWTSEQKARTILGDLQYFLAHQQDGQTATGKAVGVTRWRVNVFERWLARVREASPESSDPLQSYCDFLHHRFVLSREAGHDVGNEAAFDHWIEAGRPGYELPEP